MRNLGLLQFQSAGDLRRAEEYEAQQMADEAERRRQLVESSLGAHIRRSWESAKWAKQDVEARLLDCLRRRKGEYAPDKLTAIQKEGGSAIYAAGELELETPVRASRLAQSMGGTQVYLAEGEVNSVEDLLYALMLQSANDAAVALAEKRSGNVENFVGKMNEKAKALGMANTRFSTPHGLPISKKERVAGKQPDMTTAEDLAILSRALIRDYPQVFRFSATKNKNFRANQPKTKVLAMKNHNKLLTLFPGCDGLKTGWTNAGASIVTTASRGNRRVIAVVLGGIVPAAQKGVPDARASQRERNQRAAELMYDGLEKLDALKYEPTPNTP